MTIIETTGLINCKNYPDCFRKIGVVLEEVYNEEGLLTEKKIKFSENFQVKTCNECYINEG